MKRTLVSDKWSPKATWTLIVPIPMAWMELLPKPLTVKGGMGFRVLKLPCLGEMWQLAPELRIKGIVAMREMGGHLAVKAMGQMAVAKVSGQVK
jgi:hypothetical protein